MHLSYRVEPKISLDPFIHDIDIELIFGLYDGRGGPIPTSQVNRQLSFSQCSEASTPRAAAVGAASTACHYINKLNQHISKEAMRKRVERMMKPKEDGSLKVPDEIVKEWRNGDQQKLLDDFLQAGFDKDSLRVF